MFPRRLSIWIGPALLLASCAPEPVNVAPLKYPSLPQPAQANGQFSPEPSLVEVQLACRTAELPDNGVDDDCDGTIDVLLAGGTARFDAAPQNAPGSAADAGPAPTWLTITATHRTDSPGELRLELTESGGGTVPEEAIRRSDAQGTEVTLRRLDISELPRGRYQVTVARAGADSDPAEPSVAVSMATKGRARTYLTRLGAGESRALGAIEVP